MSGSGALSFIDKEAARLAGAQLAFISHYFPGMDERQGLEVQMTEIKRAIFGSSNDTDQETES